MKKVFSGIGLVVILGLIWAGTTRQPSDVSAIRMLDGELVSMKLLEDQIRFLQNGDEITNERRFESLFELERYTAKKTAFPHVHELLFYNMTLGQPKQASRYYTYLVANAALSNSNFIIDSDDDREQRSVQNLQILNQITKYAEQGDSDAEWVVSQIKIERGVDLTRSLK